MFCFSRRGYNTIIHVLAAEAITRLYTLTNNEGQAHEPTLINELATGRKVSSLESQLAKTSNSKRKPVSNDDAGTPSPTKKSKSELMCREYDEVLDKDWATKPESGDSVFLSRGKVEVHTDVAAPAMKVTPKDLCWGLVATNQDHTETCWKRF